MVEEVGTRDQIVVEIVLDMVVSTGKDEFCTQKRAKYFWDYPSEKSMVGR